MKKLVVFMHTSLDGFVAGPNGEMDWIHVDDGIFEYAHDRTEAADTALYGRVTYQMMNNYWPTAADQPNASKHDIEHSSWYNRVSKIVLSRTMAGQQKDKTTFISDDLATRINALKQQPGTDILVFGSPSAVHALMRENLVDEIWLFVNPILLGQGIPMFKDGKDRVKLQLTNSHVFPSGIVCLHYEKQ